MAEVKFFDVINSNLYVYRDNDLYFGIDPDELISVSRDVNTIVGVHIGDLNVRECDLEFIRSGESDKTKSSYNSPLNQFLDVLIENPGSITTNGANMFELSYTIRAQTEDYTNIHNWRNLKRHLVDPNKKFDELEEGRILRLNIKATLENMKRLYEELNSKIPDYFASLHVFNGSLQMRDPIPLGVISLEKVKSEDDSIIDKCKSDLVDRLKDVNGPCLSFDVPSISQQVFDLYDNSTNLIDNYRDVLVNPSEWKKRLFKLDP